MEDRVKALLLLACLLVTGCANEYGVIIVPGTECRIDPRACQ